jgi:hypothetical protein
MNLSNEIQAEGQTWQKGSTLFRLVTRVNAMDNKAIQQDFAVWKLGRAGQIADYLREIVLKRNTPKQMPVGGRIGKE